jgi:post-segregation antitoxin (ccd killing protein)
VYSMRMSRVNITVPDEVIAQARKAGLNVSRVATTALIEELDRRAKTQALDTYLAKLEAELGPIGPEEAAEAAAWVDAVLSPVQPALRKRRQSA